MTFQPIVNGLRLGTLVQVQGLPEDQTEHDTNGQLGQLVNYFREENKFEVACINGVTGKFDPKNVSVPQDLKKPGTGGDDTSFDVLLGPLTPADVLGEEISDCLFEKGFCVLKVCQSHAELEESCEAIRVLGDEGRLGRLPQELEEGYLGTDGKGKVIWLDPESAHAVQDPLLTQNDQNLSYLASLLQPFSADSIGKIIDERTPALLSMSLQDDEEGDYPHPMASDKILGDYLGSWRHGALRALHFMGPSVAAVTLESKGGTALGALPVSQDSVLISASPNTIIIFRTDCYHYSTVAEGEFLMMMASFLAQAPHFEITGYEGDLKALNVVGEGPQPPPGNVINVLDHTTRLASSWDSAGMMNTGLQAGTDTIVEIPATRFDVNIYYCPDPDQILMGPPRTVQRHTSFVDGVDLFDHKYFEISLNEAQGMGPLQRQVLEVGGSLMFTQGISKKVANRQSHHAGVSVGVDKDDYPTMGLDTGSSINALAIIANRFSFSFNMKGPNYICDTACSASLTATHCAKLMLYERQWDPLEFFICVGTHMCLAPGPFIGCSMSHMVSPEGRCFTFNASANGYLRGEGTSGMFLKYGGELEGREAILRSSNVGQDGRSASLTAPNGPAQEEMISRAIKEARMTPPESTCWECHGTGTSLGDPIEVGAVRKVQIKTTRPEPLMMSTAKSNIGHLEGGAAMAGMMKCIMQVMYSECFTTLHVRQLNAHLDHAAFEAFFETECSSFTFEQGHSQVSSLGFGGSNGHAIFWGKKVSGVPQDPYQMIQKRMNKMLPPEVRVIGDNPDDWDADLPEADVKPGDVYKIYFSSDDASNTAMRWIKHSDASQALEEDDDITFAITGNFNGWEDDRMAPGDVPGQHMITAAIPPEGVLEFHFIQDGDSSKVICPEEPNATRRSAPVAGPDAGLKNNWAVRGEPESDIQIELLYLQGKYSVVWFKV